MTDNNIVRNRNGNRYILKNNKPRILCKGDNDTCLKEVVDYLHNYCPMHIKELGLNNEHKDEIRWVEGRRKICDNGEWRFLCNADDNKCPRFARHGSKLCIGHNNGQLRYYDKNRVKGQKYEHNGEVKIYNGKQLCKICQYVDDKTGNKCERKIDHGDFCHTHSYFYQCKFTGNCLNRRMLDGDYCRYHINNKQNIIIRSNNEAIIAKLLNALNVTYKCNETYRYIDGEGNHHFYPDFYLYPDKIFIEFDGELHFKNIKHFHGDKGLSDRNKADVRKNNYCIENSYVLLRIPYNYTKIQIETFVYLFVTHRHKYAPGIYVPTNKDFDLYTWMDTSSWNIINYFVTFGKSINKEDYEDTELFIKDNI